MRVLDWQEIVKKNANLVWRTAYRLLGDQADAADCFQETFISAYKTSSRERIRNFSSFLVYLATRRAIDMLRKHCLRSQADINQIDTTVLKSSKPGPMQQAQSNELRAKLLQALTQLPSEQAEAFCMRCLNDMSQKQIGEKLGITANAAGVLVHRARARLQNTFKEWDKKDLRGV